MILHGMGRVLEALTDEDFPMDTHEVDYAVGDSKVEDGRGGMIPVRHLTSRIGERRFDRPEDVIEALIEATHEPPVPGEADAA